MTDRICCPGKDAMASLEKVPTGVVGLDEVLHGGLPRGSTSLIVGGPGTGKTLLGFSFVKAVGCLGGEPVVFASFEQTAEEVRRHGRTIGVDWAECESRGRVAITGSAIPSSSDAGTEQTMTDLYEEIGAACDRINARHIVLDGLDLYTGMLRDPVKEGAELFFIRRWATERGMTVLATAKSSGRRQRMDSFADFLNYGVDCSIQVFSAYEGHAFVRKLEVIKYRGSGFWAGKHALHLGAYGFAVTPLPRIELKEKSKPVHLSTGSAALDRILGGGLLRSSSNMIFGPSGSGKSTLTQMACKAALRRGERVLRLSFESPTGGEGSTAAEAGMASVGEDAKELYKVVAVMPESVSADDLVFSLLETMKRFEPDILVVDSASACQRMGSAATAHAFLVRLIGHARLAGMTRILTYLSKAGESDLIVNDLTLSPQCASIIRLDLALQGSRLRRRFVVLKCRGSTHSRASHAFDITDEGITILDEAKAEPTTAG